MRTIGVVVALLLLSGVCTTAADPPEPLTPERRQELEKAAAGLNAEGRRYYQAGNYTKAIEVFRETLDMNRALYPKANYPDGHPYLAASINNLGLLHQAAGENGKAELLMREALAMRRALFPKAKYPDGHPDLAQSLNNLGLLHKSVGEYGKAEPLYREALEMRRGLYPKAKYPDGHPDLAQSLNNLGGLHLSAGEYGKAEPLFREALDVMRAQYPKAKYSDGHPDLALSIINLGMLHKDVGEYGKAEPLLREALDMTRALFPTSKYPDGHPRLAICINGVGALHQAAGEYGKAEPLYREALDMYRALFPKAKYPDGHPDLAIILGGFGNLHHHAGEYGKAEPLYREALDMNRALYPKVRYPGGHPNLASSTSNLGTLHVSAGEYGKAEPLLGEALEMYRALYPKAQYPDGHPELATSIINLGSLHQDAGEYGKAEPLFREALAMFRAVLRRYADLAAEAESLNYAATQPRGRDALLSITREGAHAASVYDELWDARALLTRLQEQRHRTLAASRDSALRELADQLRLARLNLSRRLLRPFLQAQDQRAEVRRLTDVKEDLEKRLAAKMQLPPLPPAQTPAPQRLAERLPAGSCFVDLYRYTYYEQDPNLKGKKGEKRTPQYVAFVVCPGRGTARVELGEAETIEREWAEWHKTITATPADETAERSAAARLGRLVWEPLRRELPPNLATVYLTADAALHQLPWAALPGARPGNVLLEEHAICLVPHGPFLLQRLEEPASAPVAPGRLLATGGIDYQQRAARTDPAPADALREAALAPGGVRWPALAGTDKERQQVAALARQQVNLEVIESAGQEATTAQFQRDLPGVRFAHVATHGFFADARFRSALQLDPKEFDNRAVRDRRGGERSPLTLSGLVFAGANQSGAEAADDRGILTAEGLIGLRLEGLDLAVLSACETGLGEVGGGEGVYGLQRAFHVAGCRDVVASLWKVNDEATQALMTLFYRNLWEKKLSPAEALRHAQLTLYRNPSAVALAQQRGVDFSESDLPKEAEKPAEKGQHAPTAHWAAFTFSGVQPVRKE
jgi:CHAT domain-containing protein